MRELTLLQQKLEDSSISCELLYNEPLSKHTSFRIGGGAEVMAFPKNAGELKEIMEASALLDIKPVILGAGTNVLAPDEGLSGIVICMKDRFDGMEILDNNSVLIMAGVTMSRAAVFAANHGLSGLEFAHGIPGTVGGGVYMNAGAYGGEISHVCKQVTVIDKSGTIKVLSSEEMNFSYRHSAAMDFGYIILSAVFCLSEKPVEQIRERMKDLMGRRSASQPLDLPSAGSAFKRPAGAYAGALIEQSGLKGFQVGQAAISLKHAGFAVNLGGATAADVRSLLQQVSDIVFAKTGFRLEPEVQIW